MEFRDLIEKRKSIRAYRSDPVPEKALENIAHAVLLAPTVCNRQPFKVTVYTKKEDLQKICSVVPYFPWLSQAPAIAVVKGDDETCWKRREGDPVTDVDCAIIMQNVVMAAADEGLGSCWICAFERKRLAELLHVAEPWKIVAMTPLGFPAEDPERRPRKALSEIFEVVK